MKKFFRFAAIVAAIASIFSCQKEEGPETPELKAPAVTVDPTGKITLSEDAKDADALTISWTSVADDAEYTLNITKASEADYSKAWKKTTKETSVKFTTEELQQVMLGFGYAQGDLATVKVMVQAVSGDLTSTSADTRVQCVLYAHLVNLNTPVVTLSSTAVTLTEAEKDNAAVTATWTDASVEEVYVDYIFEWTLATDTDFAQSAKMTVSEALEYALTGSTLQYALIDKGYKAGETAELICRVTAEPAVGSIEPVTSEAVAFSVTLYERPKNEDEITTVTLLGNATEYGWDMPKLDGSKPDFEDANFEKTGENIFEKTALIKNIDTFKFYFDCNWNWGFKPGTGDFYWNDITYAPSPTMGDNDYFRLLIPGTWKFVLDTYNVTVECTLIETLLENVTLSMGETEVTVPVKDKTKATFEGTVNLEAGQDFMLYTATDHSRSFSCHPSTPQEGTSWKLFERRESDESNLHFRVENSGEYTVSIDLLNHTMSVLAL